MPRLGSISLKTPSACLIHPGVRDNTVLYQASNVFLFFEADGTAWMATYSLLMLNIAIELSMEDPVYEDMASKFFEHFISIADAMNRFGGEGE